MVDSHISVDRLLVCLVTLLFLLVISVLVTRGMTLDGTLYAAIARDMAAGEGSFWFPSTLVVGHTFQDHPPLGLYLQSLMFALVGDHFWTENLYSALTLVATISLMVLLLRLVSSSSDGVRFPAFYAVFMFLISPLVAWTYTNNYLENTLTVFMLAASLTGLMSVLRRHGWQWLLSALSGVFVFLGILTKGPVALWPLATFPLYFLIFRPAVNTLLPQFLIQLAVPAVLVTAVWFFTPGGVALEGYLKAQLGGTFSGERVAQFGRLYVLEVLGKNLVGPLVYSGVLWMLFRRAPEINRWVMFFLALGLSASLPLMLSPRQYEHYLLPALPMFALAFGCATTGLMSRFIAWLQPRSWTVYGLLLVLSGYSGVSYFEKFGAISDDRDHIAFTRLVSPYIGPDQPFQLCDDYHEDRIRAYLFRYLKAKSTMNDAAYELCLASLNGKNSETIVAHGDFRLNKLH